jgi:diketogulonate reductase-like aldo/keto reductase
VFYINILNLVNQLEISPYLQRKEITEYCQKNGIVVEGYSPLTKGLKLNDKPLVEIAAKYPGKSTAQVLIRWSLQQGYVTIPKSSKEDRIKANIDVFDFELSQEDMDRLATLEENLITGWDPTTSPWNP